MEYNFLDAIQKRFDHIYSYGGDIEKSFWQNVGKIVNKQAFAERGENVFDSVNKTAENIMNNNYKPIMTRQAEQDAIDKKTAKHTKKRREENERLKKGSAI